jgi:long-chain acyl-CoA synthetase
MSSDPADTSFGALIDRAVRAHPDQPAVIDGRISWSWRELSATVADAAAALRSYGLARGDRLVLQLETSADFVALYLGAQRAGLTVVPVNPAYTAAELSHIVGDCGARLIVTSAVSAIGAAAGLHAAHPDLLRVVVAARAGTDVASSVSQLLEDGAQADSVTADNRGSDLAVLLYTSGTSGRPKAAMLPARALLANLHQLAALQPPPVSAADRIFLPLPLFHVFGLNAGLGLALYHGASLVLSARHVVEESLAAIAAASATVLIAAPAEFDRWAAHELFSASMRGVRFGLAGSAPLDADLVARYAAVGVDLFEGYGLTEAAPVVTLNLVPLLAAEGEPSRRWLEPKAGSIGRPLPGIEVRLVDSDGDLAEPGDLGLIEVRGANLFVGYWPDGADGPRADGWFPTGDLAVADDDGDYYLIGRRTDLILVNGFNVYPAEVEAVLARHSGVAEVAVVGEADPERGQRVVAYVVARSTGLDPQDILSAAASRLARFKLPSRIELVDSLPRTATGKLQRWRVPR